ncbi:winged helix-turn-helix transcriptional regulator [Paenibacillus apiarius]|uniref:Winged helix-turn-helix transcriptional regulator n=1 Tax=Paenibacillus apiarius TaxID=46240 RepID=A0ABT4E515_9BACL|nr:winged helix-turn-helix transcriptional regulator [Paenibacillus apiarius]MCY9514115.1 winged helix-turn-helix transcriptional regulator [Paenibacillus apiarius]MCY9523438.1 winged helix-turn-helix transcriptional regulator [Paenibacillus apiarius]MCY9555610.1 winged helix-turn-helix transcriptional regulator [Paenibacillus apiarius]MCY9561579.1 winged helix-turn-helix transcriptional regulator [Paenibacillus apiarius]MCY9687189.1 winged helix-turn-helix transcriptional regulator [Paenibaci
MKLRTEYTCPLELTHDVTKGKWKPIILWQLGKNPMSLSQLEKDIQGITQKMLLEHINVGSPYQDVELSLSSLVLTIQPVGTIILEAPTSKRSVGGG